jgi:abi family protein
MGLKPFKSYEEQLNIMKKRGLIITDDEAVLKKLKRENYYNIINGYKDFFIDKQASKVKNEDVFENGTEFEHISALYDFDTEIRLLFLKNILKMENILKTKIAYFFSKSYNNQDFNYLNINNYNDTKKEDAARVIAEISNVIKNSLSQNYSGGKQIQHYINIHKNLPLWVLSKQLTFGNMSFLYSSLKESIQKEICNEIAEEYEKEYEKKIKVDEKNLEQIIKFINAIRNMCAHNDRIYSVLIKKKGNIPNIMHSHLNYYIFNSRIFDVLIILKLFVTREEFNLLLEELEGHLNRLEIIYNSNIFGKVLNETGIPKNWKNVVADLLFWEEIYENIYDIKGKEIKAIHVFMESGSEIEEEITRNEIFQKYKNFQQNIILYIYEKLKEKRKYTKISTFLIFDKGIEKISPFGGSINSFSEGLSSLIEDKRDISFENKPSKKFEKIAESFGIIPDDLKRGLIAMAEMTLELEEIETAFKLYGVI